jgi:SAM-dependent methyltransferase
LHAREIAKAGYSVHGIDLSPGMISRAGDLQRSLEPSLASRLSFDSGDARTYRTEKQFDVVVSLFHVMSYQTSNDDLLNAFATARAHLNDGGVFVFDCWYGPAVLTDPPKIAKKILRDGTLTLERTATPSIDPERNVVDVHYALEAVDGGNARDTIHETHSMRYLFTPEVKLMLAQNELDLIDSFRWMTEERPDLQSWNVCYVARG